MENLNEKYEHLKNIIKAYKSLAVAFSGGVDSTFLLKISHSILGENVIAITANIASFPDRDLDESKAFCKKENIEHIICEVDELQIPGFCENPTDRCYICKNKLFTTMISKAQELGFSIIADGSNIDDEGDYRPGLLALAELKVESPLRKAKLTKQDIRTLSKQLGLSTHDKPSFACLSSRIPYGEKITREKLAMIEKGEQILFDLGFSQFRVRLHGNIARIEVEPSDFEKIISTDTRNLITKAFSDIGFSYTSLDLNGFKSGSLNINLK